MRRTTSMLLIALLPVAARAADLDGAKLYKVKCANCHGPAGEGTKKYEKRLEGDRSVAQLAKVVFDTMPESNPGSLSKPEATAISAYVHDAFYSSVARDRLRPARVELARLTVREYRQTVADLIGSFRKPMTWSGPGGLRGEYFAGRRFGRGPAIDRTDARVEIDFKTDSPAPGKIEPHEFSVRWNGSILAPETGEYEFVVRSDHAIRLWVNHLNVALIDAWVKSGSATEFKGSLFLVGGRAYPLRLEFSKAKQGVDDSKKQKEKPPPKPAFVALHWKRPGRAVEVIPPRNLSPIVAPESYVGATPFPPDDRSYGWERGTTVSKEWDAATTDAALDAAGYVAARLPELAGSRDDATKLKAFCRTLLERAFRRPLPEAEAKALIDKQFAAAKDQETAVKRIVLIALKSPRFLYREVGCGSSSHDVAARLSFGLWNSLPDAELTRLAVSGKLTTREQIAQQVERLMNDPRAKTKIRDGLLKWAKADHDLDVAKDVKKFPGFDAALIADLRTSLELMIDDVLWSDAPDVRRLFSEESLFLNGRLAKFYGVKDGPTGSDFVKVKLDAGKRAGLLTHPYLMTSFAHSGESSPIHRGVFLARGVLGVSLRPPPEAVAPLAPDLHPSLTTRERVALQTKANVCMTCHGVINPLGFTLENFDAVGRFRENERGKPVDSTGSYQTRDGQTTTLRGARELAAFLAGNEETHEAFVEQMFHHLVQQPVRAYGPTTLDDLRREFAKNGFDIRKLVVAILATAARESRSSPLSP